MAEDNYQYQVVPLPKKPVIGDQTYSPTQIAVDPADAFSQGVSSPFENSHTPDTPVSSGSSGGTNPIPDDCGATGSLGTLNTSNVALPCDIPRSLISANAVSLVDESGNSVELSAVNGRLIISFAGNRQISIDTADLSDNDTAIFREFQNCNGQTWKALATEPA